MAAILKSAATYIFSLLTLPKYFSIQVSLKEAGWYKIMHTVRNMQWWICEHKKKHHYDFRFRCQIQNGRQLDLLLTEILKTFSILVK